MPVEGSVAPSLSLSLKPREESRLLGGHPWIFSNELAAVPKTIPPGTLAVLRGSAGALLGMGFFNPRSLIAFRLLTREPVRVDAAFFRERLQRCADYRRRHLGEVRSCRLVFGESDGLPGLVVDRYEDVLVVQVLAAGMELQLDAIGEALNEVFHPQGILLKNDHPTRALEGLTSYTRVLSGEVPDRVMIEEGGLKFLVALAGGQKTGFYFDQRENRALLQTYCKGRNVLDLHCYVGAFSLRAAQAGAARVIGVDSSEAALELARENAKLNGLERCVFEAGDAEEFLAGFSDTRRELRPDLLLLDPPSLVPSKKVLAKALRAYERMNSNALRCLGRGGLLATSTCSHHVSRELFVSMLRGAASKAQKSSRLIELRGPGKDHPVLLSMPETEYLNFALVEVG
ncbi:MAG: hypothetical protein A2X36_14545 [Elusimicrobia bacterium GWA2_69_24]|nr:MAG: hypothetical protein A2X36_14545 [Elusimicrobia bacterium GWA2_69_24]HBL18387.1 hypothetical protein [Elusimicrobiota bacterium]